MQVNYTMMFLNCQGEYISSRLIYLTVLLQTGSLSGSYQTSGLGRPSGSDSIAADTVSASKSGQVAHSRSPAFFVSIDFLYALGMVCVNFIVNFDVLIRMTYRRSQERDSSHPIYGPLTDVYVSSQNQEKHPAFPFFDFIVQLCQRSPAGCQAVLDADILDLLVCMNVHDFSIPILHPDKDDADGCRSMVLDVCHSLLMHLSGHADIFRIVLNHPICALWPKHHLFHKDLATSDEVRWKRRRLAWGQVQESLVSERLNRIPDFYYASPGDIWEMADLGDACVDLLEFMRYVDFI